MDTVPYTKVYNLIVNQICCIFAEKLHQNFWVKFFLGLDLELRVPGPRAWAACPSKFGPRLGKL